jgi:hypothetical protein
MLQAVKMELRKPAARAAEPADHRHGGLLRPRHQRPRRCAPEPRNELPAFHWITSSASAKSIAVQ